MTTREPVAVIISDIHFTPATLELATSALTQAISLAKTLNVPLILAGDTVDTKSILHAQVVNRLLDIFTPSALKHIYVLVGNHDLINEKSKENSLHFLQDRVVLVDSPWALGVGKTPTILIPYFSDNSRLQEFLLTVPSGLTLIMHQGVHGADMGHYIQDTTSLPKEVFANFRTVSGHYHKRQDIFCGDLDLGGTEGLFSYVGNPYTLTFGEANDPEKGFRVLYDDGELGFVPTNLRKHIKIDLHVTSPGDLKPISGIRKEDLLWVRLTGPKMVLDRLAKAEMGNSLFGHTNFKLDKVPVHDRTQVVMDQVRSNQTPFQVLDQFIDNSPEIRDDKEYLKTLAREILNENSDAKS